MEQWIDAKHIEEYNPVLFDFIWDKDYTCFIPRRCKWHDDVSYVKHQSEDPYA